MVYKNKISRESETESSIQLFSEAADDIATCSDDLLIVAEAIAQSCQMIGTTGDDYREVLSSRAKDFKMLAGLYKARSRRFEGIVERLAGDIDDNVELAENSLADKE
ncbi:MAG: hypothetical protein HN402_11300 [Candidatus Scalindua sp.]|jgi:hypothetical protein|nr:hypothetical protein [Candidatus Scalindua sp.]